MFGGRGRTGIVTARQQTGDLDQETRSSGECVLVVAPRTGFMMTAYLPSRRAAPNALGYFRLASLFSENFFGLSGA